MADEPTTGLAPRPIPQEDRERHVYRRAKLAELVDSLRSHKLIRYGAAGMDELALLLDITLKRDV